MSVIKAKFKLHFNVPLAEVRIPLLLESFWSDLECGKLQVVSVLGMVDFFAGSEPVGWSALDERITLMMPPPALYD